MNDASRNVAPKVFGRRIGIATFATIVASFVGICSAQILYQGFHSPDSTAALDCGQGIHRLISEIRQARAAAAVEVLGERAAMAKFRGALARDRDSRKSLERQCETDAWGKKALLAVDEWRWAEENAVRYESVDLAPSRRRIQSIESQLGLATPRTAPHLP